MLVLLSTYFRIVSLLKQFGVTFTGEVPLPFLAELRTTWFPLFCLAMNEETESLRRE
jgi:hypothetical protein